MDDSSKEDERLNASKIRGSGHLENTRSGESREHVTGMGRRENDRGRRTHRTKRRNEIRYKKVSSALRIIASGNGTGRERAGSGSLLICSPH